MPHCCHHNNEGGDAPVTQEVSQNKWVRMCNERHLKQDLNKDL